MKDENSNAFSHSSSFSLHPSSFIITAYDRCRAEELLYSSARGKFFTERDVEITRPDGVVRGKGMEATPDLSEVTIFKQRTDIKKKG